MAESLFDFSLLLRGKVAGGTTAQAHRQYQAMMAEDPRYVYYGRVVRQGDYIALHYLFFYPMNDWRSSFHGVNDHESDWEQIFVYVTEEAGDIVPQWVAFAAHDFSGDDLRRRWDDPELEKVDASHVVVYAGAGSHAAYIQPGEYLMHIEPAALAPLKQVTRPVRAYLNEALSTGAASTAPAVDSELPATTRPNSADVPLFSLAFVDYARGDGRSIGPGQDDSWSPELVSDEIPWVADYHGLWGLDTRDPFGGERAPAGPKFNRDGTVRHAWADPLGWSGLDKVPAPGKVVAETKAAIAALMLDIEQTQATMAEKRAALLSQGITVQALAGAANLGKQHAAAVKQLAESEKSIQELSGQLAGQQQTERLLRRYLADVEAGVKGDPQAHLRNRAVPEPPPPQLARAMDVWAAASGALLVAAIILLVVWRPPNWPLWIALVLLLFGLIESALRNKTTVYLLTTTIVLAVIGAVTLVIQYWQWVIPAALVGVFVYSLITNLRELRTH